MPLDAPAPFPGAARFAEDTDEVPTGVADHRPALLEFGEDRFETHDRDGLLEALLAGAGLEQLEHGLLLAVGHLFEADALAAGPLFLVLHGDEDEVGAF